MLDRGAARLRRDAPKAGGWGGHFGAPMGWRGLEERHGFAGTLRRLGGLGGHFGAPHFLRSGRGETATSRARRRSRSPSTPPRTAAGGRRARTPAPHSGRRDSRP